MLLIPLIHRYINDQLLEPGVKFHMEKRKGLSGDYTHSLSIDNTEVENAGEVKAVALNKAGETITSATLTVEGNKIVIGMNFIFVYFFSMCKSSITYYSLETCKRVFGKQCRPRSDATKCGI